MQGVVEPSDEGVPVVGVLECANLKETVCEDDEVSVLPEAETKTENEFIQYSDVSEAVLAIVDIVLVVPVGKAAMDVMLVRGSCTMLDEIESGVQYKKNNHW